MKLPLLAAVQFLTVVPVALPRVLTQREQGQALLCYPLVGLGIGIVLTFVGAALAALLPAMVAAALLLVLWVVLTGALHLDGVADTADGWLGGHGDRARTLSIMRDSHSGAAAVVAVTLILLLKFVALSALLAAGWWLIVAAAPIAGRAAMPLLLSALPYARVGGLGAEMARAVSATTAAQLAVVTFLVIAMLGAWHGGVWGGLLVVALPLGLLALWARMLRSRLGGTTGDTAGAALEALEAVVLIAACVLLPG